jgi:hypothetical protein
MMAFRSRTRKPDEDIQVFAYNLEALLRHAMPKIENGDRDVLPQQQFIEGVPAELKRNYYNDQACPMKKRLQLPSN